MLRIPALAIPDILPHPKAMRSGRDNRHSYEPEFWEFQYEIYRYLSRVSEPELFRRYRSILRNMRALISPDRHIIPIRSFLSSWYWYRKEHQTRLEFLIRGIETPMEPPIGILNNLRIDAPARPRSPNAGDILFRYGERKWMHTMVQQGFIRIAPASHYRSIEGDFARADDELAKSSFWPGDHSRITTMDGKEIPIKGDVKRTVSFPDYFVLCMSCDWDLTLFEDFQADSCVMIHNPAEFAQRIEKAAKIYLDGWYFFHGPLQYFDPYEMDRNEFFDPAMSKSFYYAYQREYRFLWVHQGGKEASGFHLLDLGDLNDVAKLYVRDEKAYKGIPSGDA